MNLYVFSEVNVIGFLVREESLVWFNVLLGFWVFIFLGEGGRGFYYFRDFFILMWLKKR